MPENSNLSPNGLGTEQRPLVVKPEKPYERPMDLLKWRAHARVFVSREPLWFLSLIVLALAVVVVFVLLKQWTLILAFVAFVFALISTNVVSPRDQDYVITTVGIKIGRKDYNYGDLKWFWYDQSDGYKVLKVATYLNFPHILEIPMPYENTEEFVKQLEEKLLKYLPYHEEKSRDLINLLDRLIARIEPWLPKSLVNWYTSKVRS